MVKENLRADGPLTGFDLFIKIESVLNSVLVSSFNEVKMDPCPRAPVPIMNRKGLLVVLMFQLIEAVQELSNEVYDDD
jgi:hypothetical protein